jgi:hypothetical protein
MRVLYIEGVAIHGGPESCVGVREGARRSVDRGRAGWAIEPRNQCDRGADAVNGSGRQHRRRRFREPLGDPARSENLGMYADLHAREPGGPMTARQWRWLPAAGREGNAEAVIP